MDYTRTLTATTREVIDLVTGNRSGTYTPAGSRVLWADKQVLVYRRAGYSDNPGSRNSGLRDYYPAEDIVYIVGEHVDGNRYWCYPVGGAEVRKRKTG